MAKTATTKYDVAEHLRTPEEMAAYIDTGNGRRRFQENAVRKALARIEQQAERVPSKLRPTILGER